MLDDNELNKRSRIILKQLLNEDYVEDEDYSDDTTANSKSSALKNKGLNNIARLQALVVKYEYNFKILHWKSAGEEFNDAHATMAQYEDDLGKFVDDLAEIAMMQGGLPCTLHDACMVSKGIEVDIKKDYSRLECFKLAVKMFTHLVEAIDRAREGATSDINSELDTIQFYCRKQESYLGKRRLM